MHSSVHHAARLRMYPSGCCTMGCCRMPPLPLAGWRAHLSTMLIIRGIQRTRCATVTAGASLENVRADKEAAGGGGSKWRWAWMVKVRAGGT